MNFLFVFVLIIDINQTITNKFYFQASEFKQRELRKEIRKELLKINMFEKLGLRIKDITFESCDAPSINFKLIN